MSDRIKKKNSKKDEFLKGTTTSLLLKVLSLSLGLLNNILIARFIGAEGSGIYFLGLTIIGIASIISDAGIARSALKIISISSDEQDWESVNGVFNLSVLLTIILSSCVTVVMFLLTPFLTYKVFLKPELLNSLYFLNLSILPVTLLNLYSNYFQGLRKVVEFTVLLMPGVGFSLFSIIGLYIFRNQGLISVSISYTFSSIIMLGVAIILFSLNTKEIRKHKQIFNIELLFRTCRSMFWIRFMNAVIGQITTVLILGRYSKVEDIGVYSICYRLASFTTVMLGSVSSISAPKFAALYKRKEFEELRVLAVKTSKINLLFGLPIIVGITAFPDIILSLFGKQFVSGKTILVILALGQIVSAATGSVDFLLMMCGEEQNARKNITLNGFINTGLNLVFIPIYGVMGAAVVDSFSTAAKNISASVISKKKLNIFPIYIPGFSLNKNNLP